MLSEGIDQLDDERHSAAERSAELSNALDEINGVAARLATVPIETDVVPLTEYLELVQTSTDSDTIQPASARDLNRVSGYLHTLRAQRTAYSSASCQWMLSNRRRCSSRQSLDDPSDMDGEQVEKRCVSESHRTENNFYT